ncbi:hypothetical protein IEQ34_004503 [Dendrobium chrysotoxum]|uniref:Cytochrome P450 n=1 Tax=Dendrobium chrysotoxum TaxID=161865 RepID=A0AAV7GZN9_DENCH|nr:hypothetical protein IEQ34_004503 [Dendrobium chrysotoxum]
MEVIDGGGKHRWQWWSMQKALQYRALAFIILVTLCTGNYESQAPKMAFIILFHFFFISLFLLSSHFLTGDDRRRLPLPPTPKGWPLLGNLLQLRSKPHRTLQILSRSHGSNGLLHLRLGTTTVIIISSASAATKCFRNHDVNLSSRPPNSVGKHIAYNFEDLVMAPYGLHWRMLRKICAIHLFSNKVLNNFQHVRDEEVVRLVHYLARREVAVDIGATVNTYVTNAMARIIVGRRVIVDGEMATKFKEMTAEISRLAGQFNGLNKKMKKSREKFGEFLEKIIAEHKLKAGDDHFNGSNHVKDFLSLLIEMNEDVHQVEKDKLTNINIKALLQDMFIAGTDTTSITVEWILVELIRHPHILARAQQELDSIVGRHRLICESDLSKFPFLHTIIKENFRLHPTIPLSIPRMTIEDFEIDGYLIPKGATLFVNVWAIGRDPITWPNDPLEFNPDRFGPGSLHENVDVKGNSFELIPFGAGRRICAGMNLGLRMIHLITAVLVHSFDWKLPDGQLPEMLDMDESYGATMRKKRPLMAKVEVGYIHKTSTMIKKDMFIVGTDTTSITVEWILVELIRHPHILARAQQELDSIVGRHRLICESDLSKFPFLHTIIKENFRLHPTIPLSIPRMTIEDFDIDGYLIPKGATVLVNVWAIGRDPATWPNDPLEFNPD